MSSGYVTSLLPSKPDGAASTLKSLDWLPVWTSPKWRVPTSAWSAEKREQCSS